MNFQTKSHRGGNIFNGQKKYTSVVEAAGEVVKIFQLV